MNELHQLIQRIRRLKNFLLIPHKIEDNLPGIAPYSANEGENALTHLIFDRWIKMNENPYYANFCALNKMLTEAFLKEKNKPQNRNKNPETDYLNALFLDRDSNFDKILFTNSSSLNADSVNQSFTVTKVINNEPSLNIDDASQLLSGEPIKHLFEQYPDIQDFFKKNIDDIDVINFAWKIAKIDVRKTLRKSIIEEHYFYYPKQKKETLVEEKTVNIEKQALIKNQNTNLINYKKRKKDEKDYYILLTKETSIEEKTKAEKIGKQKTFFDNKDTLFKFKKRKIDPSESDTIKAIQSTKSNCSK